MYIFLKEVSISDKFLFAITANATNIYLPNTVYHLDIYGQFDLKEDTVQSSHRELCFGYNRSVLAKQCV